MTTSPAQKSPKASDACSPICLCPEEVSSVLADWAETQHGIRNARITRSPLDGSIRIFDACQDVQVPHYDHAAGRIISMEEIAWRNEVALGRADFDDPRYAGPPRHSNERLFLLFEEDTSASPKRSSWLDKALRACKRINAIAFAAAAKSI